MTKMVWVMLILFSAGLSSAFAAEMFDADAARHHFNAGLDRYFKKDYEGAIREFEEAARIDPESANAYYFMGYSYYKLKDMKKAMEVFDEAYEADAKYSPLRRLPPDERPPGSE
ncbi:MAG: tetratricopeptide repeat protein [Nitrospirae bacterium]|nr:tetratricopeptide repeat protein [Nitrospirota bacterium]